MDLPSCSNISPSRNTNKRLKTNHSHEEKLKKFKYCFLPSLEHVARVNVILLAWNHPDIRNSIKNLLNTLNRHDLQNIVKISVNWRQIELEVIEKIKLLTLPKSIIEVITCYSEAVGKSIIGWILFYENMISGKIGRSVSQIVDYLDDLVLTLRGTVDYVATAQRIMNRDEITHTEKYLVACTFCLEKDIEAIYAENRAVNESHETEKRRQPMLWYWKYRMEGTINELQSRETMDTEYGSINHFVMDLIFYCGSSISGEKDAAIKYFWCKLTKLEKERIFTRVLSSSSAECCCFLLSRVNRFTEHKILKTQSRCIVELFIKNTLWLDEIIPLVRYMFQYFEEGDYSEIMKLLLSYLKYYRNKTPDYSLLYLKYADVIKEMWILSPLDYKSDIFERDDDLGAKIICGFSWEISEKIIRLIFADISLVEKKHVLVSGYGMRKCLYFIRTNQKKSFEEFLSLGFSHESDVNSFKKKLLKEHQFDIFSSIKKERGWNGCTDFLAWFLRLPQMNENVLWGQMDVTFEKFYDNNIDKVGNKAILLVYYLSENNVAYADSRSHPDNGSTTLEELLNWYLRPHEFQPVRKYVSVNMLINHCVRDNNFSLANRILRLFFSENDFIATSYYKEMFFEFPENRGLIFSLIKKDDGFETLGNYLRWCFPDTEKRTFLNGLLPIDTFLIFLQRNECKLMNDHLLWLKLSEEISRKKNEIMSGALCEIAALCCKDEINEFESTLKLNQLVEWIDPSPETINIFLYRYDFICPKNLVPVLQMYSESRGVM